MRRFAPRQGCANDTQQPSASHTHVSPARMPRCVAHTPSRLPQRGLALARDKATRSKARTPAGAASCDATSQAAEPTRTQSSRQSCARGGKCGGRRDHDSRPVTHVIVNERVSLSVFAARDPAHMQDEDRSNSRILLSNSLVLLGGAKFCG